MTVQFRKPQRISITISDHVYQQLMQHSDLQGRSLSNLAAYLLESAMGHVPTQLAQNSEPLVGSSINRSVGVQSALQPLTMLQR
jgi:hypothetical protein